MRVAVVARDMDSAPEDRARRRLDRLITSLSARGHAVGVFCHPWWDRPGDTRRSNAVAATDDAESADERDGSREATENADPDAGVDSDVVNPDAGVDSDVVDPDEGVDSDVDGDSDRTVDDGARPRSITVDGLRYRGLPRKRRWPFTLVGALLRFDPDVIHVTARPSQTIAASVAGSIARCPLVVEYADSAPPDGLADRLGLREPGAVVTPSELVRTRVREHLRNDEHVRVIPTSVAVERIHEIDPVGEDDAVFAAPLDGRSGLDDLLLALAELRDRDFAVTVFGEGPRRADLEAQVRDLRIDDRVTFRGWPDTETRIARYCGAHTFVQAARVESFAVELLRALVAGCVGIVEYQADSSAHELIVHRDRHFRVTDPEEIADALLAAGDLDRQTASSEFDEYDHVAVLERYLDLYRDLGRDYGWV